MKIIDLSFNNKPRRLPTEPDYSTMDMTKLSAVEFINALITTNQELKNIPNLEHNETYCYQDKPPY